MQAVHICEAGEAGVDFFGVGEEKRWHRGFGGFGFALAFWSACAVVAFRQRMKCVQIGIQV